MGRGQNEENIKVRYYPKPLYAGALIWEYPAGTQWLVGCRRAADGAMEVAAAFLLPALIEQPEETSHNRESSPKTSLEEQILNAERQR